MVYHPTHHARHSIRLPGWDYGQASAYFVTVVTQGRECVFEDQVLRRVAETFWQAIPVHAGNAELDAWVVMPNHVHGIIILNGRGNLNEEVACPAKMRPGSLGAIIGNFKSVSARRINVIRHTPGLDVWQRNYYEHIVRNERELQAVRQYILDNPAHWAEDAENPWQRR